MVTHGNCFVLGMYLCIGRVVEANSVLGVYLYIAPSAWHVSDRISTSSDLNDLTNWMQLACPLLETPSRSPATESAPRCKTMALGF